MKLTRRVLCWAAALAAVAGAGGAALARPRRAAPPPFATAAVDRGAVVVKVTATGTVSARRTVLVSSQVSGRVKELAVDFNTPVKRGQLLARIDPQPFDAALAQATSSAAAARANVEKARAKVADLERQAARKRTLADRRLVATEELETAEADLAMARAELAAAQASVAQAGGALDQARYNLAQAAIRSPIDGFVISRDVDEGQTVAASLQAPTLFTLAEDLHRMEVKAHVSEGDVGRISERMPATFTVSAWPREPFTGSVRQVRTAAQTVENVVTYDVVIDAENPDLRLRPGMTATVTFVVAERKDALRVPNAALRFRPPGAPAEAAAAAGGAPRDRKLIHVVTPSGLRPVPVRAGVTDGAFTEIVEGDLAPGDLVATGSGAAPTAAAASTPPSGGAPPPPPGPRLF